MVFLLGKPSVQHVSHGNQVFRTMLWMYGVVASAREDLLKTQKYLHFYRATRNQRNQSINQLTFYNSFVFKSIDSNAWSIWMKLSGFTAFFSKWLLDVTYKPQQQAPQPRQRQGEPIVEAKLCWYLAKPNQPRWERLVETTWVESLKKGDLVGGKSVKVTERENITFN